MFCAKFGLNRASGPEEKSFKYFEWIFTILLLSPLGKGRGPSFEQTCIPYTLGCFLSSLVEIGPVVLENMFFNKFRYCIFAIL